MPKKKRGAIAASAPADDGVIETAKGHYRRGEVHYKLGRFEDALAAFSLAYETKPVPAFLFNIAQCHFNLRHWERAIFFFEGFLRDGGAHPAILDARARLVDAKREYARQKAEPQPVAQPSSQPIIVYQPREISSAPVTQPAYAPVAEEPPPPVYKRWWFWTILGVVVAGGAAAAVVYFVVPPRIVPPEGTAGTVDWRMP